MPETLPLVSIVIPNYNYARTLDLCLAALTKQSYPHIEVIVVDDRSTDDSPAVARRHGVKLIVTETNVGVAAARNLGVEHANGEILFFLDSDVALAPDAVEKAVARLTSDSSIGVVCGVYEPEPLILDSLVERYRSLQLYYWISSDAGDIGTIYAAIFAMRAQVFREIGPFNPALRHSENADYGNRVTRHYRILLDRAIRGAHDHDDRLSVVLAKFFHRARLHMPLYLRRPGFDGGPADSSRGWGALAASLAVVSTPLPVLFGAAWLAVPAVLLLASVAVDFGTYRFIWGYAGGGFTAYFAGIQFLVNVTVVAAAFVGLVQCLLSREFRRTYDHAGQNAPATEV